MVKVSCNSSKELSRTLAKHKKQYNTYHVKTDDVEFSNSQTENHQTEKKLKSLK